MSELNGQMSIFQMMDDYEAMRMPYEACKEGVIAWTIECAAITYAPALLREAEAPAAPREISDFQRGLVAPAEGSGATAKNSWDTAAPVQFISARPRKIKFKADSRKDQYGWSLFYDSVGGPGEYFGGWGSRCDVFVTRPTDADCERYAREHYKRDKRITADTPFRMWT